MLLAATGAAGCATAGTASGPDAVDPPRRLTLAMRDNIAEAYYHYATAQMLVQDGKFKEAVPVMQEAIKRDPTSAFLWSQLAQWLVRADAPAEALSAARRAVQLAPSQPQAHITLAELLRAQKKYADAEAELEKA